MLGLHLFVREGLLRFFLFGALGGDTRITRLLTIFLTAELGFLSVCVSFRAEVFLD
jgi:hypothetical protein